MKKERLKMSFQVIGIAFTLGTGLLTAIAAVIREITRESPQSNNSYYIKNEPPEYEYVPCNTWQEG
jgi:hypothetical protein